MSVGKIFDLVTSGLPCKGFAFLTKKSVVRSEISINSEIRVVTFTCLFVWNLVILWVIQQIEIIS